MGRLTWVFKLFWREPVWFKVVILTALVGAIVFSSSYFADRPLYQSGAKAAAAIFFLTYGIKLRYNRFVSTIMFVVAGISFYLAWSLLT